ncbi:MAG: acyltransferase [Candidatus Hydrogenedentes bacterium]|nr:acyltransferase [Candidatus Hydrogenedentota bacterium]
MNTLVRTWLSLKHRRKFARLGKRCQFPIELVNIYGHVEMGDRCRFRNNATCRTWGEGKILFGNRTGLSWGCLVEAHELVTIGAYAGIAEYTYITDTHYCFQNTETGWQAAPVETAPVHIGENTFIGSGCFIGPGVTIGDSAVVGNHSVVLSDVGPLEIWVGNPARKIGHRTEGVPEAKLQEYRDLVAKQGIQEDRYE